MDFLDLREVVTLVNRWSQTCGLPVGGMKCDKIAVEDRYLETCKVAVFNRSIVYRVYPALTERKRRQGRVMCRTAFCVSAFSLSLPYALCERKILIRSGAGTLQNSNAE